MSDEVVGSYLTCTHSLESKVIKALFLAFCLPTVNFLMPAATGFYFQECSIIVHASFQYHASFCQRTTSSKILQTFSCLAWCYATSRHFALSDPALHRRTSSHTSSQRSHGGTQRRRDALERRRHLFSRAPLHSFWRCDSVTLPVAPCAKHQGPGALGPGPGRAAVAGLRAGGLGAGGLDVCVGAPTRPTRYVSVGVIGVGTLL